MEGDKRERIDRQRRPVGDLRGPAALADGDAGFIYRTTQASYLDFPARSSASFEGVAGPFLTSVLTT